MRVSASVGGSEISSVSLVAGEVVTHRRAGTNDVAPTIAFNPTINPTPVTVNPTDLSNGSIDAIRSGLARTSDVQVTVNPTVLSAGSVDAIRSGLARTSDVQVTVNPTVNPTVLSTGSVDAIRNGLARTADVQVTVNPTPVTVNPTVLSTESVEAIRNGLATSQQVQAAAVVGVSIPAIEAASIVLDQEVTKYRGTFWAFVITGLVSLPQKSYWTIKRSTESDAKATLQVVVATPAIDGHGLKILNGSTVVPEHASRASITYDEYQEAGATRYRATLMLLPEASALILPDIYRLDLKDVSANSDQVLAECVLRVVNPVTLATS